MKGLVAFALACHHDAAPAPTPPRPLDPVTTEPITYLCAHYGYYGLAMSGGGTPTPYYMRADQEARHEAEIAVHADELGDHHEAALRFLACAKAYRIVPDDDPARADAAESADLCYGNAMWAFANAQAWAKEGKAAMERAIVEDPRLADAIRKRLADPPGDCDPKGSP